MQTKTITWRNVSRFATFLVNLSTRCPLKVPYAHWGHKDFKKSPVAIVGAREYIFSENIGILGDLAVGKHQTFGALTARSLSWLGGKLHYGHPDFLNAIYMTTRGGVSKAQKGLHLNEDIYAGMTAFGRGGCNATNAARDETSVLA